MRIMVRWILSWFATTLNHFEVLFPYKKMNTRVQSKRKRCLINNAMPRIFCIDNVLADLYKLIPLNTIDM